MPANWVYIITYVMVFGFAVYIGFLIGQELAAATSSPHALTGPPISEASSRSCWPSRSFPP